MIEELSKEAEKDGDSNGVGDEGGEGGGGDDDDEVEEVPAPEREYTDDELEADLQNITDFFAVEPEGSDESLWVDLAKKVSIRRSWGFAVSDSHSIG